MTVLFLAGAAGASWDGPGTFAQALQARGVAATHDAVAERPFFSFYEEPDGECRGFLCGAVWQLATCGTGNLYQANVLLEGDEAAGPLVLELFAGAADERGAAIVAAMNEAFQREGAPLLRDARARLGVPTLELTVFLQPDGLLVGYDLPLRVADVAGAEAGAFAFDGGSYARLDAGRWVVATGSGGAALFEVPETPGAPGSWEDPPELAAFAADLNERFATLGGGAYDVLLRKGGADAGFHLVTAEA